MLIKYERIKPPLNVISVNGYRTHRDLRAYGGESHDQNLENLPVRRVEAIV